MDTVIYTSIPAILESASTLEARIAMLDSILNGMELAMVKAASTGEFTSYSIDTGQTKNSVQYRSLTELQMSYEKLLKTQQFLYARLNNNRVGRVIRLVPNQNFIGNGYFGI